MVEVEPRNCEVVRVSYTFDVEVSIVAFRSSYLIRNHLRHRGNPAQGSIATWRSPRDMLVPKLMRRISPERCNRWRKASGDREEETNCRGKDAYFETRGYVGLEGEVSARSLYPPVPMVRG